MPHEPEQTPETHRDLGLAANSSNVSSLPKTEPSVTVEFKQSGIANAHTNE